MFLRLISNLPKLKSFSLSLVTFFSSNPSTLSQCAQFHPPTIQDLKESLAFSISQTPLSPTQLHLLHSRVLASGLHQNLYICTLLITKYFALGLHTYARRVFDSLHTKPTKALPWNSLMRAYFKHGQPQLVLDLYFEMVQSSPQCAPDNRTFNLVVAACSDLQDPELGALAHSHIREMGLERDLLVGTALVAMYCKFGLVEIARAVFDEMPVRDVAAWNAMVTGFSKAGFVDEVLRLYREMRFGLGVLATEETMVGVVSVFGASRLCKGGEVIHAHVMKIGFLSTVFVCNSLVEMYVKWGCVNLASKMFEEVVVRDAVSWSTMIGGYVRNGRSCDALRLFRKMIANTDILPTRPILLGAILACAEVGDLLQGKEIEDNYIKYSSYGFESNVCLNTALIYMYAKCDKIQVSMKILERISPQGEVVIPWNAMIKACSELGQLDKASKIMLDMQRRGIDADHITFLMLLSLFSSHSLLVKGVEAHACVIKYGFESERAISHCLIDMYAKSGQIGDSVLIFSGILDKDVITCSLMIKCYSMNGCGREAIDLFIQMKELGVKPNHITFLAVLTACSHSGLVEKGNELFNFMKECGLEPEVEHYACLVDLLCRAGRLSEAYQLVESMDEGHRSCARIWGSLLIACREHGDLAIGEQVARNLFYLEPENAGNFLMLANMYTEVNRRKDANDVLRLLGKKHLMKRPGWSWIEGGFF